MLTSQWFDWMTTKVNAYAKADSEYYKPLVFTPSVPPPAGAPRGRCDGRCRKTHCPGTTVSINRELKPQIIPHVPTVEQNALEGESRQSGERSTGLCSGLLEGLIREEGTNQGNAIKPSPASKLQKQSTELTAEELDAILMEGTPENENIDSDTNDKTGRDYVPCKSTTLLRGSA